MHPLFVPVTCRDSEEGSGLLGRQLRPFDPAGPHPKSVSSVGWAATHTTLVPRWRIMASGKARLNGIQLLVTATPEFRAALEVCVPEAHSAEWPEIHKNQDHIHETIGDRDIVATIKHYRETLRVVDNALVVSNLDHTPDRFNDAVMIHKRITRKINAAGS